MKTSIKIWIKKTKHKTTGSVTAQVQFLELGTHKLLSVGKKKKKELRKYICSIHDQTKVYF